MFDRGPIIMMSLLLLLISLSRYECQSPIDPDVKARLEAKVIQSMSLKELEEMVEKDERVLTAPRSKLILIPRGSRDPHQEAYVIQRKQKGVLSKQIVPKEEFRYENKNFDDEFDAPFGKEFGSPLLRRSYLPKYNLENPFKFDEDFPSLFRMADLRQEGSNPVKNFYETVVEKVIGQRADSEERLPVLDIAGSDSVSYYKPRFNYESYSKDPTEVKLRGKKYWRDAPTRRGETVDENGCRTIVKKIIDPEDEKKPSGANAKSVIITKECESPSLDGPDAKIQEMSAPVRVGMTGSQFEPLASFENKRSSYESSRPEELDLPSAKSQDPIAPDYIDRMLESHFKSFPSFKNPLTSFRGYQDRFKLQIPSGFKDVKPTVNVDSYDRSSPQSGFNDDIRGVEYSNKELPKSNKHSFRYDYPAEPSSKQISGHNQELPKSNKHSFLYEYPGESSSKQVSGHNDEPLNYDDGQHEPAYPREYAIKKEFPSDDKFSNKKEPKMMKKSYAYYRKDNPKEDPNDQQYAEEFSQGNYRSFSSDYDSDRDGPKKE